MLRIEVTNSFCHVTGPDAEILELDNLTSYPVEGAQFSPSFRNHVWDGREHLLRKSKKKEGGWMLPAGLLSDLEEFLKDAEVIDNRRPLSGKTRELKWIGTPNRDYQLKAVAAALKDRGLSTGRGILNLPIRSGKTRIAADLIQKLGCQTLFVVPSDLLLFQTIDAFKELLDPAPVGIVGAGNFKPDWITIATAQTLLKRKKKSAELMNGADMLIVDEAHHLEGPAWRKMILRSDAPYKFGLSATVFVSQLKDNTKASIWLKGCTGPILYRVSMARLIRQGHLVQPQVVFVKYRHDPRARNWGWQRVVKECLAQCRGRNRLLANLAEKAVKAGKRVMIDTGRHDQMKTLNHFLTARGVVVEMIHGQTPPTKRWDIIRRLQSQETQCLIGTVLGEGVDIPELEVVINAEGQKSDKAAIQRMRNLTPSEGKSSVVFLDIADLGQPYLQRHSLERLKLYKGMRGFIVKVLDNAELFLPSASD